jgi:hypothetical protein
VITSSSLGCRKRNPIVRVRPSSPSRPSFREVGFPSGPLRPFGGSGSDRSAGAPSASRFCPGLDNPSILISAVICGCSDHGSRQRGQSRPRPAAMRMRERRKLGGHGATSSSRENPSNVQGCGSEESRQSLYCAGAALDGRLALKTACREKIRRLDVDYPHLRCVATLCKGVRIADRRIDIGRVAGWHTSKVSLATHL